MSLFSRLELVEHDVEGRVVEDKVDLVLVELADHGQRHVVIWINEHQVLDEQDVHDVRSLTVVYGDSRVALCKDLRNF